MREHGKTRCGGEAGSADGRESSFSAADVRYCRAGDRSQPHPALHRVSLAARDPGANVETRRAEPRLANGGVRRAFRDGDRLDYLAGQRGLRRRRRMAGVVAPACGWFAARHRADVAGAIRDCAPHRWLRSASFIRRVRCATNTHSSTRSSCAEQGDRTNALRLLDELTHHDSRAASAGECAAVPHPRRLGRFAHVPAAESSARRARPRSKLAPALFPRAWRDRRCSTSW